MELDRGIEPQGFGGYGTLGPFVYFRYVRITWLTPTREDYVRNEILSACKPNQKKKRQLPPVPLVECTCVFGGLSI